MSKRIARPGVVEAIARKILDQTWLPGEPVPPVRILAGLFGVARATMDAAVKEAVSRGLLETRPRQGTYVAREAIAQARNLRSQTRRHQTKIAVVLPAPHETDHAGFYNAILTLVKDKARKRGWEAETVFWPVAKHSSFPKPLGERGFDGAFCVAAQPDRLVALHFMRERRFPVVVFNRRLMSLPLPTITFDEYGAAQQIGKLLHGMGHRRITFLTMHASAAEHFDDRQIAGWLDFCRQNQLFEHWEEPVYVICHPDVRRALGAYLRRRPRPTAVVLGSAALADAFLDLGDLQLRVPDDLSVVAWRCEPQAVTSDRYPDLTSVIPNLDRMAECSLEMLGRMINGEPYPPPLRLPCTLVRTDSIGPPLESGPERPVTYL